VILVHEITLQPYTLSSKRTRVGDGEQEGRVIGIGREEDDKLTSLGQ